MKDIRGEGEADHRRIGVRRLEIESRVLGSWPMLVLLLALGSGVVYIGLMAWWMWKK